MSGSGTGGIHRALAVKSKTIVQCQGQGLVVVSELQLWRVTTIVNLPEYLRSSHSRTAEPQLVGDVKRDTGEAKAANRGPREAQKAT